MGGQNRQGFVGSWVRSSIGELNQSGDPSDNSDTRETSENSEHVETCGQTIGMIVVL